MRVGCLATVIGLYIFAAYGLYVSWGFVAFILFTLCVGIIAVFMFTRLKKSPQEEVVEKQNQIDLEFQPIIQDPDSLLAQFRLEHKQNIDEEEEQFQRAVEEVKNRQYSDDSPRIVWIQTLEQYANRFIQRAQLKTKDPVMKRLNSLLIMNSFLYVRVFVNLVEIASAMNRLPNDTVARLDSALIRLSKYDFERLMRMISLHFVNLFLTDHTASVYFNESFTKRSFTAEVMNGLSFSKQETLLLQGIQTDTQYMEVLLNQLELDNNKQLIDLAKTSFENTKTRLIEKMLNEIN